MQEILYSDFKKLEMRVGKIVLAESIPRTTKLFKINVDVGDKRIQIISSLVGHYKAKELIGKQIIVLTNLKPTKFSGESSEGMLLCAEDEKKGIYVSL